VLAARPDLAAPLAASLRAELGEDTTARLERLGREEPAELGALQLVIVAAYYTDPGVRELIGYPGQLAIEVKAWQYPPYLEEGLIDAVLARGPVKPRSEEHTSELQSRSDLVCRLLLEKKKNKNKR